MAEQNGVLDAKSGLVNRVYHALRWRLKHQGPAPWLSLAADYVYDFRRYARHSAAIGGTNSALSRAALITKEYHRIEKGMALPEPRPGFGRASILRLLRLTPEMEKQGGGLAARGARGALRVYAERQRAAGAALHEGLNAFVADPVGDGAPGGVISLGRDEVQSAARGDFESLAASRHSVRQYTGEPVSAQELTEAVRVALRTPCVCNRESRRVHVALDPELRTKMLSFQNGNRGFGDRSGAVLAVTSDLRNFLDLGERNQGFVDGGLFAMSLVYALHAQGLGTCMLNWSAGRTRDRKMRKVMGIADHEVVITMIAVGRLPERFEVAASPRPEPADLLNILG
jgi:nitroreductase